MRNYIEATWNDADQYNYSGEQIGNRGRKSGRVHFNPDGSACVASYGDDEPKVSKVSIKDRILPQFKRLQTLRTQMVDLEKEYKTTDMTCEEYSILRDVIVCKIERAEVLYKKAVSVRPIREETEEVSEKYAYSSCDVDYTDTEVAPTGCGVGWISDFIDDLPPSNSFKSFLKMSCKVVKTAVHYKHKISSYIDELKAV
jgi:hypothetical protein